MKALHSAKYGRFAKHSERKGGQHGRRLVSLLLCLCMVVSMMCNFGGWVLSSAVAAEATGNVMNRIADKNTMDDYLNQLLSKEWGSRYAGRIWTDKSVFAYADGKNVINLDMETDGYNGMVKFNADFAHVFSALASSQVVNEYPPSPIDMVLVLDISSSMSDDVTPPAGSVWEEIHNDLVGYFNSHESEIPESISNNFENEHYLQFRFKTEQWKNGSIVTDTKTFNNTEFPTDDLFTRDDVDSNGKMYTREAVEAFLAKVHEGMYITRTAGNDWEISDAPTDSSKGFPENTNNNCRRIAAVEIYKTGDYWTGLEAGQEYTSPAEVTAAKAFEYTRLLNLMASADRLIDTLMQQNPENRVSVVVYDRRAEVSMPLAHYTPNTKTLGELWESEDGGIYDSAYLSSSGGNKTDYLLRVAEKLKTQTFKYICPYFDGHSAGTTHPLKYADATGFSVVATPREDVTVKDVDTKIKDHGEISRISGTNTNAGITAGLEQLANEKVTTFSARLSSGKISTVPRIPAAIVMTDGGSNTIANGQWYDPDYDLPVQRSDYKNSWSSVVVTQSLLNAAYLKSAVEKNYIEYMALNGGGQDLPVYTVGVDLRDDSDDWVPSRLYPMMDPASYFLPSDRVPSEVPNPSVAGGNLQLDEDDRKLIGDAYADYQKWLALGTAADSVSREFPLTRWSSSHSRTEGAFMQNEGDSNQYVIPFQPEDPTKAAEWHGTADWENGTQGTFTIPSSPTDSNYLAGTAIYESFASLQSKANASLEGGLLYAQNHGMTYVDNESKETLTRHVDAVTQEDMKSNINYVTEFYNVTSAEMGSIFESILTAVIGQVFVPVSGENDAGVSDSITYQDPLGDYMEIKNQSIFAQTHKDGGLQPYDMALLIFGQMHGLVRAGVYDYQWNNKWMEHHKGEPDPTTPGQTITPDTTPFPMGWYRGDDPETAERAEHTESDGAGTYPTRNNDGTESYESAEAARAAGWVFRLNFKTLLTFVPIADAPEDGLPGGLSNQVKNTVYTCYRFAGTSAERNALHINPIFGDESDIPQNIRDQWAAYAETGAYPDTNALYAGVPGVYRLSDIRVWIEDVGDYTDTSGVIVPNTGYDRSLYMNIPAAAVPTQLATITLGQNGVESYETNLGADHPTGGTMNGKTLSREDYYAQSTPLRLFYAVGLEESLILRDDTPQHNQIGVDFTNISPEYIKSHTVEGQDYIWFISNYFSNTTYDDYVTGANQTSRGDPTMTFSPSVENRYYIFQKPLPLYAHAYRNTAEGLKPVDNTDDWRNADGSWTANHENGKGNGSTTWESITDSEGNPVQQRAGSWVGGEYMGTYTDDAAFENAKTDLEDGYITDSTGTKYLYLEDGIVLFTNDALNHVTSEAGGGYSENSMSFDSNDFFFLLVEYYVPNSEKVTDDDGNEILGATGGRMVQHVVARKGSEFGSGFVSEDINNGDMLCWVLMNQDINMQFDYLSKTDTGDRTRGEPTFEKLTYTGAELETYLQGIELDQTKQISWTNSKGEEKTGTAYDQALEYWQEMQQNNQVKAALAEAENAAKTAGDEWNAANFNKYMQFAVAAKPGGIRSGNMASNVHAKQDFEQDGELVDGNVTGTAENYYVPVVSANSGIGDNTILNNYMGNNGYLEIANQMLHVTKMLEAPEGFELTEKQLNEEFNYQIYVQGVTGTRSAIRTQYNEYGKVWERELAYIDVLTDNSNLVLDNNSRRAVFIEDKISSSIGEVSTAKMVVENGGQYYIANEDGTLTLNADGSVNTAVNSEVGAEKQLYYLYLPSNSSDGHTRRLFQNKEYDGTAEGYPGTYATDKENYDSKFQPNGVTTFVNPGDHAVTGTDPGADNRDSYRETVAGRPAGTRTYWAQDAELIPIDEVQAAETVVGDTGGGIATYAPESVSGGMWTHGNTCADGHVKLQYYNLVIRRPEGETSETAFTSPLSTRSQYMTVELEFGKNANATDGSAAGALTPDDIYDKIIPSADRSDLFGNVKKSDGTEGPIDNAYIAEHTAEFTLHHGEGLLLSGLDNRITYRFTEKLTDEQLKQGYTLKRISHVQQRGSDTVYMPGVQNVSVNVDRSGNIITPPNNEPYAHTNATIWESYSTMTTLGNHHQPEASEGGAAQNPSCTNAGSEAELDVGKCDLPQPDGSTRHYFYYGGKLVDPHYDGEQDGMSRYVLNPTAHFGVNGEEDMTDALTSVPSTILQSQKSGDTEYYDYNGVYSVYGNTGWFEEQVNFVNTIEPDMLVVTKEVVDKSGNHVAPTSDMVFDYTLELADIQSETGTTPALTGYDTLYLWRGSKDTMTSALKWTDKDAPTNEYAMPVTAPNLDEYREFIPTAESSPTDGKTYLQPVTLKKEGEKLTYKFQLRADEAVVFYGIPAGTDYTVTETNNPNYPIHPTYKAGDPYSEAGKNVQTGEVLHYRETSLDTSRTVNHIAMRAEDTDNRENYYNLISTGSLGVEKQIHDDDKWEVDKTFTFTVTLTAGGEKTLNAETLTVTKYKKTEAGGETSEDITKSVSWNSTVVDGKTVLTAEIKLMHGERFVISGIPMDTKYTVKETGRDGYNLEYVVNVIETPDITNPDNFIHPTDFSTNGEITEEHPQANWLFVNAKPPFLPFSGSGGVGLFYLLGGALIISGIVFMCFCKKRRVRVK